MVSGITYSAYQNIARISSTIDRVIIEASSAKTRINAEMYSLITGLGKNVDIMV